MVKNWLFKPNSKIIPKEQRRQANFLSMLLMFLLLMTIGYLLVIQLFLPGQDQTTLTINAILTIMVLFAAYVVSRTQWYETAVYVFAIGFGAIIVHTVTPPPETAILFVYFMIPVIIATMVLSIRKTGIVTLIEFIAIIYLTLRLDTPRLFWQEITLLITLYVSFSGIILLSLRHRNQLEQTRQAQMLHQETRLQTYFNNATDWLFALDKAGNVSFVNKIACQDLGYSADEIIGQSPIRFLVTEQQATIANMLQEVFLGREVAFVETIVQSKNGSSLWIEIKGGKLFKDNVFVGTFHVARNITKRKIAEAAREKLIQQSQNELQERKRAEIEARKRQAVAETLQAAIAILNSTLSLEDVLKQILAQLGNAIPYDSAAIQQKEDTRLILIAASGFQDDASLIGLNFPLDANLPNAQAVRTKMPLALDDVRESYPEFYKIAVKHQAGDICSWLGVPLIAENKVIGMITIDRNEKRPFSLDEITLATTFANHAAMAMHNAALYRKLETHSETLEKAVMSRTLELQRTTDQVRAILNNSPDAIFLLDADLAIQHWNSALLTLFEYVNDEVGQLNYLQFAVQSDQDTFKQAIEKVATTHTTLRFDMTAQSKNGRFTEVNTALAPIQENNVLTGIVCSLHDISQLKEVERLKDTFVSNVSHELRTPITNLRLHHDLIQLNPQKQDVYMARLGREINRLNIIIEDLLRISRLDQKRIKPILAELDLPTLAEQYLHDRESSAHNKQLTLSLTKEPPIPTIQGDSRLLEQVIGILLTNAMIHTPPGGKIKLCPRFKQDGEQIWAGLCISDTGSGIPENEQSQIFTRFFRGQSAIETGEPGTGLGLAIAQEIMHLHQGYIELERSTPQNGSTFIMWLPTQ